MMMYKAQVICILIILFISIFYFTSDVKETPSRRWFSAFMIISVIQLIFDILSVYTVNHLQTVPEFINRTVHVFYMGFMLTLFYLVYKYVEALIEEELGARISRLKYSVVPLLCAVFGVIFFPIEYIETPKGNYSYGPAAFMIYIGVMVYLIFIIRILVKHSKDIPFKKRKVLILAVFCQLLVGIYQVLVPTALVTCFAIVLLNVGIYLTAENPDTVLVDLLQKETKRADIANQAKTDFLAHMSHEIRTPINTVLGMNEVILRETKEPVIREYARDVQGAAKSLLNIINDILDITKIEAGKLTIICTEYVFSGMIHDVINMISFKARTKELNFAVDIDERIPNKLLGDDIRLRQILINLLNNAVKYTHEGTVSLKAELLPQEKENTARIFFSVKDTGIGIKEEDIPKLAIAFERIEEERNRSIEGTGLGMTITLRLLAMLNSRLEVKSEYGVGSEFSFILEQEIIDPEPIGDMEERIKQSNMDYDYQIAYEAPEAKVLVVDDNEMNRKVFCSLLKDTKIQITEAPGGRECLELVKHTAFDIIFMDHMMPELDGVETFHEMKKLEDYPCKDTPVVILTANAIAGAKEQYLKEGFEAFLSKPIDSQKLEALVEKLLDEKLVKHVKRETTMQPMACDTEELPVINGLDWEYASSHFKDREAMLSTVTFFVSTIEYDARELELLYEGISQEEGRKNYCTKVHSMKNSASIIGIIPLAGMAKVLEDAARKNEQMILTQLTPIFLSSWREYKEHLKMFAAVTESTKAAGEHKEQVQELFKQIKSAAEDMDIDALDELLKELETYQFEQEQEELIAAVKKAIINFDVEFLQTI